MTNRTLLAELGDLIARTPDPADQALLAKVAARLLTLAIVAELADHQQAAA